jgi:hypothetical protein
MVMLMFLRWWYGEGWQLQVVRLKERLAVTFDYFSIELLLKTFFAPFRQISAGSVRGPVGVQLRAFFDRLISRIIGAMIRTFMIIIGVVTIIFVSLLGALRIIAWIFVPVLPIIGIVLTLIGWMPWT